MSELEYCAFCDGGYAHSGICDKCTTEIGQTGKELADKDRQLAEARAEIARKDKLIDLLKCCATCERQRDVFCPDSCKRNPIRIDRAKLPDKWTPGTKELKAALAAERGE